MGGLLLIKLFRKVFIKAGLFLFLTFGIFINFFVFSRTNSVYAMENLFNKQYSENFEEKFKGCDDELKRENVVLHKTDEKDFDALGLILFSYDDRELKHLFEPSDERFKTLQEAIENIKNRVKDKNTLSYTMFDKTGEKVLGYISLNFENFFYGPIVQYFIFVDKNYFGKQVGENAALAVTEMLCKNFPNLAVAHISSWDSDKAGVKIKKEVCGALVEELKKYNNTLVEDHSQTVDVTFQTYDDKSKKQKKEDHKLQFGCVVNGVILNKVCAVIEKDPELIKELVQTVKTSKTVNYDVILKKIYSKIGNIFGMWMSEMCDSSSVV